MYHFRSAHAAASTDAMSTVIDGADQAQYGLPYFAQDDKSTSNGLKYKVGFVHNVKQPRMSEPIGCVCVCVCVDRQDCMLPLCMGSLPMRTCSQGTCPVGQMPLWKLCTGTS